MRDGRPQLAGYNINSAALIVNWCTEMIASAAARPILLIARMA